MLDAWDPLKRVEVLAKARKLHEAGTLWKLPPKEPAVLGAVASVEEAVEEKEQDVILNENEDEGECEEVAEPQQEEVDLVVLTLNRTSGRNRKKTKKHDE
jgi:hypothetical protein